jgi:hypothetical protein
MHARNHNDDLKTWLKHPEIQRSMEAYKMMAALDYRPEAPLTGLTPEQTKDQHRSEMEALRYAMRFWQDENSCNYHIGTTNWRTKRAFELGLEALRCLSAGILDAAAVQLFEKALAEVKGATK